MDFFDVEDDDNLEARLHGIYNESDESKSYDFDGDEFDAFDSLVEDIDFSDLSGTDFKKTFTRVNKKIDTKISTPKTSSTRTFSSNKLSSIGRINRRPINPGNTRQVRQKLDFKRPLIKNVPVEKRATIHGGSKKMISKVIVPKDRSVIVEGVSKFMLSQDKRDDSIKEVAYHNGKKLKELVLIFNNDGLVDFNLQIFDPSMPLDYLYSTSQNLNDKVQVAGGAVQYSDILFNLLANPTLIHNCYFTFTGPLVDQQVNIPLKFISKDLRGFEKIDPVNMSLKIDNLQVANNIVAFNMNASLNRPFIPDGMDVINYTVLKGNTVTMAFFYEQISLKKVFYEEARKSKNLL